MKKIKQKLKKMDWDELSGSLIDLELDFAKNKNDRVKLLISLYEKEKATRLTKTVNVGRFMQDEQMVAFDWTYEIVND